MLVPRFNNPCNNKASTNGTGTKCGSFTKYLYASAPNNAVKAESKAGFNTGFSNTGVNGIKHATPIAITNVVTIVLVATEIVETISPSFEPCFTPASSLALTTQGTFKLTKLPVKKPR